jgi:hypothetical protein
MNHFFNNTFLISQLQRLRSQNSSFNSELGWNIANNNQENFAKNLLLSNQFENPFLNSKEFLPQEIKCLTPEVSPKIIERQRVSNDFPLSLINRTDDNLGFPGAGIDLSFKLFPSGSYMAQERNFQHSEEKVLDNLFQSIKKPDLESNEIKNLFTDPEKTITARTFSNKISSNNY